MNLLQLAKAFAEECAGNISPTLFIRTSVGEPVAVEVGDLFDEGISIPLRRNLLQAILAQTGRRMNLTARWSACLTVRLILSRGWCDGTIRQNLRPISPGLPGVPTG